MVYPFMHLNWRTILIFYLTILPHLLDGYFKCPEISNFTFDEYENNNPKRTYCNLPNVSIDTLFISNDKISLSEGANLQNSAVLSLENGIYLVTYVYLNPLCHRFPIQIEVVDIKFQPLLAYSRFEKRLVLRNDASISNNTNFAHGCDTRLFADDGHIYALSHLYPHLTLAEVFNDTRSTFFINQNSRLVIDDRIFGRKEQKNWSPFTFNKELYFVQSINPHTIVAINRSSISSTEFFHGSPYVNITLLYESKFDSKFWDVKYKNIIYL